MICFYFINPLQSNLCVWHFLLCYNFINLIRYYYHTLIFLILYFCTDIFYPIHSSPLKCNLSTLVFLLYSTLSSFSLLSFTMVWSYLIIYLRPFLCDLLYPSLPFLTMITQPFITTLHSTLISHIGLNRIDLDFIRSL